MESVWELEHKPDFAQEKHAEDLAAIMPPAKALIRDQSIGFVFIHSAGTAPSGHLRP